ncbi:MAG: hypothetical protein C4339_03675 [Nitrososphaerota archaeon]
MNRPLYLHAQLWLSALTVLLTTLPMRPAFLVDLHAVLGLVLLGTAHYCRVKLGQGRAHASLARIALWTAVLVTAQAALGLALYAAFRIGAPMPADVYTGLSAVHLVIGLGILAESAGLFTGYGIWRQLVPSGEAQEARA